MTDEIEPDFYATISGPIDDDEGQLRLIVATTDSVDSDSSEDDVVLTAELPDLDPINAANKILATLDEEGLARWQFLRTWYEDGDTLRAELEGSPGRLRFPRIDIYFLNVEGFTPEEFRLYKCNDTDYFMFLPQAGDKFEIWREDDGTWRTDFPGEEEIVYDSLADLVEQAYLTA